MSVGVSNLCKQTILCRTHRIVMAIVQKDYILLRVHPKIGVLYSSRDYFMGKQGHAWGVLTKWDERA